MIMDEGRSPESAEPQFVQGWVHMGNGIKVLEWHVFNCLEPSAYPRLWYVQPGFFPTLQQYQLVLGIPLASRMTAQLRSV
jgi:hypothetical protein